MSNTVVRLFFVLVLALFYLSFQDQSTAATPPAYLNPNSIDDLFHRESLFGFSGALLIAQHDRVLLEKGYGMADRADHIPITPRTVFPIGSMAKQFVAASILQLETGGKLKLTETLPTFFPNVPPDKSPINIRELLTHTSGMGNHYAAEGIFDRTEAVSRILEPPLAAPIGSKWIYCNDGYNLLAAIVETVSGQSFENYVRKHVFIPAGMTSTGFFGDALWDKARIALPYNQQNQNELINRTDWGHLGSGGVISTVGDILKWLQSLRDGRIISKSQLNEMLAPRAEIETGISYGYAWIVEGSPVLNYSHSGDDTPRGFSSELSWYPAEDIVTVVFANVEQGGHAGVRAVTDELETMLLGGSLQMPPADFAIQDADLAKYVGTYKLTGTNDTFQAMRDPKGLVISTSSQPVLNLITGADDDVLAREEAASELISKVLEAQVKGDQGQINPTVFKATKSFGKLASFSKVASANLFMGGKQVTTYVKLVFDQGQHQFRFVTGPGGVNLVIPDDHTPGLFVCEASSANSCIAYDTFCKTSVYVNFTTNPSGGAVATLHQKNVTLVATSSR
jgi:CubicO group peptidase (beta-lactamase class C family)